MYIFLLSILLLSLITLLWLIFYLKKCYFNYKKNNIKILETIIYQSLKKRKNNIPNLKNNAKTSKIKTFYKTNTFYIHLHKCKIYHKFNNFLHIKNQIYPERKILSALKKIIPIIREVEKKINYNKNTYRGFSNQTIIETVAEAYVQEILTKNNFNVFESFSILTQLMKVYKKEAEILSVLLISNLAKIYIRLVKDLSKIKKDVVRGSRINRIKNKNNFALIYGIALLNKSSNLIISKYKLDFIDATTKTINELDQILLKQRVILNYINILGNGLN